MAIYKWKNKKKRKPKTYCPDHISPCACGTDRKPDTPGDAAKEEATGISGDDFRSANTGWRWNQEP